MLTSLLLSTLLSTVPVAETSLSEATGNFVTHDEINIGEDRRGSRIGEDRRGSRIGEDRRGSRIGEDRRGSRIGEDRRGSRI